MGLLRTVLGGLLGGRADAAREELAAAIGDEQVLLGPASANYRGSTGGYSRVKGNGTLALTPTRLLFRKVVGGPLDVDLESVTGLSRSTVFAGSVVGGHEHLVVHTVNGDLAWYVPDLAQWQAAIEAAIAR